MRLFKRKSEEQGVRKWRNYQEYILTINLNLTLVLILFAKKLTENSLHFQEYEIIRSFLRRILKNAFLTLNLTIAISFGCFSHSINNKINRIYDRCLRIIYNEKLFEKLLNKDNSVSIHYNNIHTLAIKLYKIANISPKIMSEVFKLRDTPCYNLQHTSHFSTVPIHSVYKGTESASYLQKLKIRTFLIGLKEKSKHGNPLNVHVEFVGHL